MEKKKKGFSSMTELSQKKEQDIQEQSNKLKFEREQLLSIFNSIEHPIYVTDPVSYRIIFANERLNNAFKKNMIGEVCYQALQGKEKPCEFCTNHIIGSFIIQKHNVIINSWIK